MAQDRYINVASLARHFNDIELNQKAGREISMDYFEQAMEACLAGEGPIEKVGVWLSRPENATRFYAALERLRNPFLAAVDKALESEDG